MYHGGVNWFSVYSYSGMGCSCEVAKCKAILRKCVDLPFTFNLFASKKSGAKKSEAQRYPVNIVCVYAAGSWSEGHASYLGRSAGLPWFFSRAG